MATQSENKAPREDDYSAEEKQQKAAQKQEDQTVD
jgi:hypothetical protein